MNDIVNFISTVGFPIGSCLLCMYYIYKDKTQTNHTITSNQNFFTNK